jgi:hypothetical protein
MSAAAITVIVVVVVVLVVVLIAAAMPMARRRRLQRRFGPEYDRVVAEKQSRRQAEAELADRERRVQRLEIRSLSPASRARYASEWMTVQERFVDQPQQAVTEAQRLVTSVMTERGYRRRPAEEPGQIMADLSVEHASALDGYRRAQEISQNAATASTEDLRQAMVHYRALFSDLLGRPDEAEATATDGRPTASSVPADEFGGATGPQATEASPQATEASLQATEASSQAGR